MAKYCIVRVTDAGFKLEGTSNSIEELEKQLIKPKPSSQADWATKYIIKIEGVYAPTYIDETESSKWHIHKKVDNE